MRADKRLAKRRQRRHFRVRNVFRKSVSTRPRLSVFRSNNHIYAQIIDDAAGQTLAAASTLEKDLAGPGQYAGNRDAAARVGRIIAQRALERGITQVVFDRGRYKYHGRVAALATAAREGGLDF
ncbi:MAG TPA: 50S ribosomal protein L18 [Planctomycetaceae bacterium]|nr:50S ribosomal protein L18 [Planctomycetaceae bacterium]